MLNLFSRQVAVIGAGRGRSLFDYLLQHSRHIPRRLLAEYPLSFFFMIGYCFSVFIYYARDKEGFSIRSIRGKCMKRAGKLER